LAGQENEEHGNGGHAVSRRDGPATGSTGAQQIERSPVEIGHQVRVPMGVWMDGLEPVEIVLGVTVDDRILSSERQVADYAVEVRICASEHLRELNLSVKRRNSLVGPDSDLDWLVRIGIRTHLSGIRTHINPPPAAEN
jgi:hypothetical protein